ncbi:MAG: hypothetical protein JXB49_14425 [Bacteroidales bacterium]|nr:hypothetical protein [Bacteroidales bacterium]
MKTHNYFVKIFYLLIVVSIFYLSCKKDDENKKTEIIPDSAELKAYRAVIVEINSGVIQCTTFVATKDGSVIANYTSNDDLKISKVTSTGDIVWEYIYGRPGNQVLNIGELIILADESVIFTGGVEEDQYNMDMFIIKISSDGNLLWEKTFDYNEWEVAYTVIQTSDNGYLLAGTDFNVTKTNEYGEAQWDTNFGLSATYSAIYSIVQPDDNAFTFVGYSDIEGYVYKVNMNSREIEWKIKLPEYYSPVGIVTGNDGGYMVLARYYDPDKEIRYPVNLIKLDDDGNILWSKDPENNKSTMSPIKIRKLGFSGYYVIVERETLSGDINYEILKFNNLGEPVN